MLSILRVTLNKQQTHTAIARGHSTNSKITEVKHDFSFYVALFRLRHRYESGSLAARVDGCAVASPSSAVTFYFEDLMTISSESIFLRKPVL